jgi:hypothetical protein
MERDSRSDQVGYQVKELVMAKRKKPQKQAIERVTTYTPKVTFKLYPKQRVASAYSAPDYSNAPPTEESARFGWAGADVAEEAYAQLAGEFPKFFIANQVNASDGKRVVLWDCAQKVLGAHIPTNNQEVGDCVSQGAANAVAYLQVVEINRLNDPEKYRPVFQPYIYGVSRVLIGNGRIRGDGSVGVWAAEGVRKYGILAADEPEVPSYSGTVARSWGKSGPPDKFIQIGKNHLIQTIAKVTSYEQVRDAIVNGYPVTVASDRGFRMNGTADRGKLWGSPYGVWNHQMCFIGVDDDAKRPGVYVINSWGPNAHGKPVDDAPPGGFWVDARVVDYMVKQQDSFAYSQFDGFPEQDLDFNLI